MPLLARCWDFLAEGGYTAIVIGSQALSIHLLKLSEREKGQLDWRVAFPFKDLDISVPALEKGRGLWNLPLGPECLEEVPYPHGL